MMPSYTKSNFEVFIFIVPLKLENKEVNNEFNTIFVFYAKVFTSENVISKNKSSFYHFQTKYDVVIVLKN